MADNLITVGAGNDTIYVDGSIATLRTSSGSSTISVGKNDTIDAGAGNDLVSVISGSNLYIAGGDGSDLFHYDEDDPTATLLSSITIDGGDGDDRIESRGSYLLIYGGSGNDYISTDER